VIGQTISHYRIVEKIGGGGMGVVYKAEDTRLHRFVALTSSCWKFPETLRLLSRFQGGGRLPCAAGNCCAASCCAGPDP
jgi:serine/threonine protein kinase